VTWLIIPLLVLIPAGYLVVAAEQSRASGRDPQLRAELAGMVEDWPSVVQRRVYKVPVPSNAVRVGYFESDSWRTDTLYVQFTTSAGGLDSFLAQLGTSRAALTDGHVTITAEQADRVGWRFSPGHTWSGISRPRTEGLPAQQITVNLDDPDVPAVYLASTVTF
jgi:hypothetical protein